MKMIVSSAIALVLIAGSALAQNYDNPAGAGTSAPGQEQRNEGQGGADPHGPKSGPDQGQNGRAFDEPLGDAGVQARG